MAYIYRFSELTSAIRYCIYQYNSRFKAKSQYFLPECHLKLKTGLRKVKNRTLVDKTAFCWHS
jgi:hypothetical protein